MICKPDEVDSTDVVHVTDVSPTTARLCKAASPTEIAMTPDLKGVAFARTSKLLK
jgi:hypothetical protein